MAIMFMAQNRSIHSTHTHTMKAIPFKCIHKRVDTYELSIHDIVSNTGTLDAAVYVLCRMEWLKCRALHTNVRCHRIFRIDSNNSVWMMLVCNAFYIGCYSSVLFHAPSLLTHRVLLLFSCVRERSNDIFFPFSAYCIPPPRSHKLVWFIFMGIVYAETLKFLHVRGTVLVWVSIHI